MMAQARDPVVPPSQVRPGVPYDLEQVIMRCLAKAPSDRFPSARALGDALARLRRRGRVGAEPRRSLVGRRGPQRLLKPSGDIRRRTRFRVTESGSRIPNVCPWTLPLRNPESEIGNSSPMQLAPGSARIRDPMVGGNG